MHSDHLDRGSHDGLYDRFLFPTLGVSIIGRPRPNFALVLLDRPRFVGLTPLLPTRFPSGDDIAKTSLPRAFRAACFLRADIHSDTLQVMEHPSAPLSVRNLPYIRKIPAWPQTTTGCEEELEFNLLEDVYHAERHRFENRWMYAGIWQDKPVAVKFARRYWPELHHFCAERGHAPKLFGYTIPGGWIVVVMGYVAHDSDIVYLASRHWTRWNKDLTDLVQSFHDDGLVHGDLRNANFIVPRDDPGRIVLVDFYLEVTSERFHIILGFSTMS
ncbi:hypothetical protein EDB89DRAFT_704123 [Lactarius sanguifluus]|nr:hypothetical protein EDB89DRAFT_704123 [Lactarius sanguifluus]